MQQLRDGVGVVDPDGLPGSGSCGRMHRAFDAVRHTLHGGLMLKPFNLLVGCVAERPCAVQPSPAHLALARWNAR
jgi:hypothetical protein